VTSRPTDGAPGAGPILVLDTATATALVGLADRTGAIVAVERWPAGHRHGEELLARVERLLAVAGVAPRDIGAIVVGTGPGAFTGLRVGIATAKGLAHGLGIPLVGVPTGLALLAAATAPAGPGGSGPTPDAPVALLLPAGPVDRVLVRPDLPATLLPAGTEPELAEGTTLVAVDLADRAPAAALSLGSRALEGLGAALARLGAERLAGGTAEDARTGLATLVPDYVTLPRGVRTATGEVSWSRDPR
jgi:hypothetical protein